LIDVAAGVPPAGESGQNEDPSWWSPHEVKNSTSTGASTAGFTSCV
jgi:hypothetical protein